MWVGTDMHQCTSGPTATCRYTKTARENSSWFLIRSWCQFQYMCPFLSMPQSLCQCLGLCICTASASAAPCQLALSVSWKGARTFSMLVISDVTRANSRTSAEENCGHHTSCAFWKFSLQNLRAQAWVSLKCGEPSEPVRFSPAPTLFFLPI